MLFFTKPEIRKEIKYYNSLPVIFDGFLDIDGLRCGDVELVCSDKRPADRLRGYVPSYGFRIKATGIGVGYVSLRVGYTNNLYYGGQIGYSVDEPYRGRGYAGKACRALIPLMKAHGMTKALITNNPDNIASRRVCEKLGAKFLRVAKIPLTNEMFQDGERYKNIFEWDFAGE
jgi:predicted acetyltransferase